MTACIRIAVARDADAIHAIYAPHVGSDAVTFETAMPDVAEIRARVLARLPHYPWLVWDDNGHVLAYAYAGRFRERAAYDWIAETSIYVRPDMQRHGIARKLYGVLFDAMRLQGIVQAVGVITLPGTASVAFHESLGFTAAGVWRSAGYKLGQWWDVGIWQKQLLTSPKPPSPVHSFSELADSLALRKALELS